MRLVNDVVGLHCIAAATAQRMLAVTHSHSHSQNKVDVQMVVTAAQMATSQFHSVAERHQSLSPWWVGRPAGSVIGLNANQRRSLLSSPADLPLPCQPNNGRDGGRPIVSPATYRNDLCPAWQDCTRCHGNAGVYRNEVTGAPASLTCILYENV